MDLPFGGVPTMKERIHSVKILSAICLLALVAFFVMFLAYALLTGDAQPFEHALGTTLAVSLFTLLPVYIIGALVILIDV